MIAIRKKVKRNNFKPWIFAILITLAAHGILVLLFTNKNIEENTSQFKNNSVISMLPIDTSDPKLKTLVYWMRDENPTLIVKPNQQYGYSNILKHNYSDFDYSKTVLNIDPLFDFNFIFTPLNITPQIPVNPKSPSELFSKLDTTQTAGIPSIPYDINIVKSVSYPYYENSLTGEVLPVTFNNIEEVKSLVKKYNPSKPTILSVNIASNSNFYPFIKIISSCGYPELDKIAVDNIFNKKFSHNLNDRYLGKKITVSIEWQESFLRNNDE